MNTFIPWKSKYPDSWFSCQPGSNGFLPVSTPLVTLPEKYDSINKLLENMQISKEGYLSKNEFKEQVDKKLEYFDVYGETDVQLVAALFRDYCFLASAYSLESSHFNLDGDGNYGEAVNVLPKTISGPLLVLSKKVNVIPWLDYAYGYGLNNAIQPDESSDKGDHKSYKTIRMFNGHESESGFINVHVAMVSYSGELLMHQQNILKFAAENNSKELLNSLTNHYIVFTKIIESLQRMWKACERSKYLSFRTFIMGQKGNKKMYPTESIHYLLPDGTKQEHSYRGETGAQDSLIPSIDNLFQIYYPKNKLTEYLYDLRNYRPKDHQEYIEYNYEMSKNVDLINKVSRDVECSLALLKNLNILRIFRGKHWNLTKMYIIKNTKHPVATGGTPITTWLPNQLGATIETMYKVVEYIKPNEKSLNTTDYHDYSSIKLELDEHHQRLFDEVQSLQREFNSQDHESFLSR